MQLDDDRTPEQRATHCVLVGGTDRFLSGWGKAAGGASFAFWACRPEDERRVLEWVERRSDIKRVRVVGNDYKPRGRGHCHVYVVDDEHPALERKRALMLADAAASTERATAAAQARFQP